MSGFDHQDWENVVIRSKSKQTEERKKKASVTSHRSAEEAKFIKMESEDYVAEKPKLEVRIFIQQARNKRGLSQKELATKLCVQPNIIQQWEAGKTVVPGNCISALNKALKVNIKKQEFLD